MSEPKWTVGTRRAYQGRCRWIVEPVRSGPNDGTVIGDFFGPDAEANANLDAAAPELYEALDSLVRITWDRDATTTDLFRRIDELRPILAKARGEHE